MAGRRKDFGHFGAQGAPAAEALGIGLEKMVSGVASPR